MGPSSSTAVRSLPHSEIVVVLVKPLAKDGVRHDASRHLNHVNLLCTVMMAIIAKRE